MNPNVSGLRYKAGLLCLYCIGWFGCSDADTSQGSASSEVIRPMLEFRVDTPEQRLTTATVSRKTKTSTSYKKYVDSVRAAKDRWAQWVRAHPFSNRNADFIKGVDSIPKRDRPDLAAEYYFLRTVDPALGIVPRERLFAADEQGLVQSFES